MVVINSTMFSTNFWLQVIGDLSKINDLRGKIKQLNVAPVAPVAPVEPVVPVVHLVPESVFREVTTQAFIEKKHTPLILS
jgi:hypothetical protein